MNLLVMGATGRTGRLVTEQALARGHNVTVLVRRPDALTPAERLRSVVGGPSAAVLTPIFVGQEAIISCLGQRSAQDAHLLQEAAAATLAAMQNSAVRRYLVVSQGLLTPSRNPLIALLRLVLTRAVADSTAMEALVRASDTDWTIVRPPRLTAGKSARFYRARVGGQVPGAWTMQYADLAAFLIDAAENRSYVREIVGVASA
jgi:putative NADH-flavin reductase